MYEYWDSVARALPRSPVYSLFGRTVAPYWRVERRLAVHLSLSHAPPIPEGARSLVLKTDLWNKGMDSSSGDVFALLPGGGEAVEVVGIDCSPVVCDVAKHGMSCHGAAIACADVSALPFKDEAFDAILDLSTLDHIPPTHTSQVIAEYQRVLKGGGVVALVFDATTYRWQRYLQRAFNRARYSEVAQYQMWWRLSPLRVKCIIRESGLSLLHESPMGILSMSPLLVRVAGSSMIRKAFVGPLYRSGLDARLTRLSRYLFPLSSQYLFVARKPG